MALKHWNGTVPQKAVVWKCVACTAENSGPLEKGCTACGAGDPAKAGKGMPVVLPDVRRELTADVAFTAWLQEQRTMDTATQVIARDAWEAGAEWALQRREPLVGQPLVSDALRRLTTDPQTVPPGGGWRMHLITPEGLIGEPVDPRTHATVLAALAFYKDNQLGYGDIPGQLTAAECSQLIGQLQDPEPPQELL